MERLSALRRLAVARIPVRQRIALGRAAEWAFNLGPDVLFVLARRRFGRMVASGGTAFPPWLLRLAAYRRHIPSTVTTFELLGRPDLQMVNVESIGTQIMYWTGHQWVARNGAGMEIWEQLCRRASKITEVGANVGFYSVAGGRAAQGAYTAVEPHPHSCAALRANLELNGIDRVEVVEGAAVSSPAPATVELVCTLGTDRAAPSGAMVKGSPFDVGHSAETVSIVVRAYAFDEMVRGCDLVKIDVEGLEAKLLASGYDELRLSRPALMVEVHEHNGDLRRLLPRLLHDLDATAYAMRSDHLVPVTHDTMTAGPLPSTWDYLIVPAVRAPMVSGLVRG